MPQTHISALHTGAGAGALLTAVCGSVVIVRVCGGAVGIGAISLGRENVEKLPSSEDASYTQVHLYTEALMFTFQIVSKYKAGPLWPPAKHFLSISQIFFAGISVTMLPNVVGAAYYCGVAALRTGADSAHVFCDAAAASVIRGYTTELVIHPVLDQEYGMEEVSPAPHSTGWV